MGDHTIISIISPVLMILVVLELIVAGAGAAEVPCMYVFGDSLVDNGNNNDLLTMARANYLPYGIDFVDGVTGRFTNGRTSIDILSLLLGFGRYIPPFASATREDLVVGVNYASGAGGIREETGNNLGDHLSLREQVDNFRQTVNELRTMAMQSNRPIRNNNNNNNNATNIVRQQLSKCLFTLGMGSNDYLNNYYMPDYYSTSSSYTTTSYAGSLLHDYAAQLMELYNLGARKVALFGIGQIGCIPYQLSRAPENSTGCVTHINQAILIFNNGIRSLVDRFNQNLPGAKFTFINSFVSFQYLMDNANSYGLSVVDRGCCGVGRNNGQITCLPFQSSCDNRQEHIFWDAFHPTDAANVILAQRSYGATSPLEAHPLNIHQLARAT